MKTIKILVVILLMTNIIGCKTKNIAKVTKSQEIELPFSGAKYESNNKSFRAVKHGTSTNLIVAEEFAHANARTDIAYQINTVVENVSDIYLNQKNENAGVKFERMSRQTSKEMMTNITTLNKKVFLNDDEYTFWVVMEVKKKDVVNIVYLQQNEQLGFDKYEYEKIFDKEMEDFQKIKR
jgi:hypothetical protein